MRSTMCLLLAGLLAAGCDRATAPSEQANVAAPPAGPTRTVDRRHRGEAAPAFAFTGPDGRRTSLVAFRGRPVLVNLWATWCGPCVKELPTLDALAARQAGKLQVVALSQDTRAEKVAPFLAARRLATLKAYTDPDMAWVPAIAADLPTTILYDAAGREVWRVTGDLDWTGPAATAALS